MVAPPKPRLGVEPRGVGETSREGRAKEDPALPVARLEREGPREGEAPPKEEVPNARLPIIPAFTGVSRRTADPSLAVLRLPGVHSFETVEKDPLVLVEGVKTDRLAGLVLQGRELKEEGPGVAARSCTIYDEDIVEVGLGVVARM